jgi:hypothetical protein
MCLARTDALGVAAALIAASLATTARAGESSYTSIAKKACRELGALKIEDTTYVASRVCAGRDGYKIFIDEEDLRETLSVGRTLKQAADEPAARDLFGAFNGYEDKVEWRAGNDGKPYALIAGWSFADNDNVDAAGRPNSARFLVVMRLPPGPVCKVAYIDRVANSDAGEFARQSADATARNFKCGTDSVQVIGKRGSAAAALLRQLEETKPKP